MSKVCTGCNIKKSLLEFYKNSRMKDGYFKKCKSCQNYTSNNWRKNNIEKSREISRLSKRNTKEHIRIYEKEKHAKDPNYKLKKRLRARVRKALKRNWKTGSAISDLGCSIEELKQHLESKFKNGMTWENMSKWHLDHIRPLSSFDLTDKEQFFQACHFTNLQPLWAEENLRKSDKYEGTK